LHGRGGRWSRGKVWFGFGFIIEDKPGLVRALRAAARVIAVTPIAEAATVGFVIVVPQREMFAASTHEGGVFVVFVVVFVVGARAREFI
jgi:hypothetical protein